MSWYRDSRHLYKEYSYEDAINNGIEKVYCYKKLKSAKPHKKNKARCFLHFWSHFNMLTFLIKAYQ